MRITDVMPTEGFQLRITFDDGTTKTVDIEPLLRGDGSMVRPLREDPAVFRAVRADDGTVVWPNGFDLDPDVLYYDDLRQAAPVRTDGATAA
jgi:hypothetical protein